MLIVITGPSGVGKTTIIESLLKSDPNLKYSVSLTTRQPRSGEVNGVDYFFVSDEEFQKAIANAEFAEWSEVYGKYYGRLRRDLEEQMRCSDVLVGIDVQGALKLRSKYPEGVFIFLLPRSQKALEAQLRGRRTDDEASVKTRLDAALREMRQAESFDYKVINHKIGETVRKIESILTAEKDAIETSRRSQRLNKGG
jgi:guanylate kinase